VLKGNNPTQFASFLKNKNSHKPMFCMDLIKAGTAIAKYPTE
jgi:hypothetical protein